MPVKIYEISESAVLRKRRAALAAREEGKVKVRMLVSQRGSPDGINVESYQAGGVYELPPSLAAVFLREGWAEEDKMLSGPSEVKAEAIAAPEPEKRGRRKR